MTTRSQTLFSIVAPAAAQGAVRRAAWQPTLQQQTAARRATVDALSGLPVRQALRGLLGWLLRARALNSQAL